MTVLIPQRNNNKEGVEEEKDAKEISVRFQPIGSSSGNISYCSCGCGARYVVAYLKHNGGGGSNGGAEEEAHHRLQATLDASFDAMFTIDQKGTILMANQAAVTLLDTNRSMTFLDKTCRCCAVPNMPTSTTSTYSTI